MRRISSARGLCAATLLLCCAAPAFAISINNEAGSGDPHQRAEDLGQPFDAVARVLFTGGGSCSGALISTTTVLTANHCIDGVDAAAITVDFNEAGAAAAPSSAVTEVTAFPATAIAAGDPSPFLDFELGDLADLNGYDLAILTLETTIDTLDPFTLFGGDPIGRAGRMVGYGQRGLGDSGLEAGTAGEIRRAADNVMDFELTITPPGADPITVPNIVAADFDAPGPGSLPDEGGIGFGDSGGPILTQAGGEWLLMGVASAVARSDMSDAFGSYGTFSIWTGVYTDAARDFLVTEGGGTYAPIPTPGAGLLLVSAVGMTALTRRRGRRAA